MKKFSHEEFIELMKKKETITVVTNDGIYDLTGITDYKVCIELRFLLKKGYLIGTTGTFIRLTNIVTTTEAHSMYMSF